MRRAFAFIVVAGVSACGSFLSTSGDEGGPADAGTPVAPGADGGGPVEPDDASSPTNDGAAAAHDGARTEDAATCAPFVEGFEPNGDEGPWTPDRNGWMPVTQGNGSRSFTGSSLGSGRNGTNGRLQSFNVSDSDKATLVRDLLGSCWREVELWIAFDGPFESQDSVKLMRLEFDSLVGPKTFILHVEAKELVLTGSDGLEEKRPLPTADGYHGVKLSVGPTGEVIFGLDTWSVVRPASPTIKVGSGIALEIGLLNGANPATGTGIRIDDVTLR